MKSENLWGEATPEEDKNRHILWVFFSETMKKIEITKYDVR